MWMATRGTAPTPTELETGLSDSKAMFEARFGKDTDDNHKADEPAGAATCGAAPKPAELETGLPDVKPCSRPGSARASRTMTEPKGQYGPWHVELHPLVLSWRLVFSI